MNVSNRSPANNGFFTHMHMRETSVESRAAVRNQFHRVASSNFDR